MQDPRCSFHLTYLLFYECWAAFLLTLVLWSLEEEVECPSHFLTNLFQFCKSKLECKRREKFTLSVHI